MMLSILLLALFQVSYSSRLPSAEVGNVKGLCTGIPFNIAHRGDYGEAPEESVFAYRRAIEVGADFIEADIVATKDGRLICFHDVILDEVTDIAQHPEFENRKRTYEVDGVNGTGYFTVDFTLKELKTLRLLQRYGFRDQSYNGKFQILTFEEYISIALNARRIVGIYPEIKNPLFFNSKVKFPGGDRFEDAFVKILKKYGYGGKYLSEEWLKKPLFIQSFAPSALIHIKDKIDSPKVLLLGSGVTFDTNQSFEDLTSDSYLDYISTIVDGLGPPKEALLPVDESKNRLLPASDLIDKAHARGLQVHPWTFHNEYNLDLPFDYHQDPYLEYDTFVNKIGVDGVFTDFPETFELYRKKWGLKN